MHALTGIRVLDLTHVFAGPFCAHQLGVMGAEVIKIEPVDWPDMTRDGGARADWDDMGMSTGFQGQGAGKACVALDLKHPMGQEVFRDLVRSADVLVQNYTTGCLDRLGLDWPSLKAVNPRLVCCSISGFGRTGPKADHPAYDVVIQAFTGVMAANGEPDSLPVRVGPAMIDYGTGAQAAMAVCAALFDRERTGEGRFIDVAMADAALMLMTSHVAVAGATGRAPRPHGNTDPGNATYSAYPTADGTLMLGAWTSKQAAAAMRALGNPQAAAEIEGGRVRDLAARAATDAAWLRKRLQERPAAEWEDLLNAAHVPAARVRTLDEALAEPQFAARPVLARGIGEDAPSVLTVAAFDTDAGPPRLASAPRRHGADTMAVLEALGYDAGQRAALLDLGVVAD